MGVMRKIFKTMIILIVVIVSLAADTPIFLNATLEQKIKIVVAGDDDFRPYEYVDRDGRYKGFNVDIMTAIGEITGVEIEIRPMRWEQAVTALERGEIDALMGMSQTKERKKKYAFTRHILVNSHSIFVLSKNDNIRHIKDLAGMKVAYQERDVHEKEVKAIPYIIPVKYATQPQCIDALLKQEVDAFIGNRLSTLYYLNSIRRFNEVKVLDEILQETLYGPVTLPHNKLAFDIIDGGLMLLKLNGSFDEIYSKWFGGHLHGHLVIQNLIKYLIIAGILMLAVFAFLIIWNKQLDIQVSKRTQELEKMNRNLQEQKEKVYKLAFYDFLTGLPNKAFFTHQAMELLASLHPERYAAVFRIDIDNFRYINTYFGYEVGDEALKIIGKKLQQLAKNLSSESLVARNSEDEYLVFINNLESEAEINSIAKKIDDELKSHIVFKGFNMYFTASMGIAAVEKKDGDSQFLIDLLLKNSEIALYEAKMGGGNRFIKYNYEFETKLVYKAYENLSILSELREAINNNQFILYYQPKFDIIRNSICGFEALIRWQHPVKGIIMPDKFIALAEETGLIFPINQQVLNNVCRQCKEWLEKGYQFDRIFFNVSPREFLQLDFLKNIKKILDLFAIPPQRIGIEITETAALTDIAYSVEILNNLKKLGIAIALDDFGTGYSNLIYLSSLDLDEIKIDKSFIQNLETDQVKMDIIRAVVLLAKHRNISVTAEGVETQEQLNILKVLGVNVAQGFYFSKPLPSWDVEKFLLT